jgi:archaemetzincin
VSDRRTGASNDRVQRRIATEAIQELGHTYGLRHCTDQRCVMWCSNTLVESDRKGMAFCQPHQKQLMAQLA